jgi:hypothetical protein
VLAYLFWHWPRDDIDTETYERSLAAFHEALMAAPSDGLRGSATFRIEGATWVGPVPRAYEDWYLLDGSFALDLLNEAAVSGSRRGPHDDAARAAAGGAGGLYQLKSGEPEVAGARFVAWLTKPPDTDYQDFYALLEPWTGQPGRSLWRRQMVLGPAPEFCLLGVERLRFPASLEPVGVERELIWRR